MTSITFTMAKTLACKLHQELFRKSTTANRYDNVLIFSICINNHFNLIDLTCHIFTEDSKILHFNSFTNGKSLTTLLLSEFYAAGWPHFCSLLPPIFSLYLAWHCFRKINGSYLANADDRYDCRNTAIAHFQRQK